MRSCTLEGEMPSEEVEEMQNERGRVVVGVDGSAGSRAALVHALRDAARRGAAIDVVAVFESPQYYWVPPYTAPLVSFEEVREDVRRYTDSMVQEVTGELSGELSPMPPVTVHVVPGSASKALLDAAEDADLLVVGSRGHGAVGSLLLGSVSLACTLHAPCPITVVHATRPKKVEEPAVLHAAPAVS
jgi:nucleotide-binding universal stress UspA family protein